MLPAGADSGDELRLRAARRHIGQYARTVAGLSTFVFIRKRRAKDRIKLLYSFWRGRKCTVFG